MNRTKKTKKVAPIDLKKGKVRIEDVHYVKHQDELMIFTYEKSGEGNTDKIPPRKNEGGANFPHR